MVGLLTSPNLATTTPLVRSHTLTVPLSVPNATSPSPPSFPAFTVTNFCSTSHDRTVHRCGDWVRARILYQGKPSEAAWLDLYLG